MLKWLYEFDPGFGKWLHIKTVSYTHLDVYKRQAFDFITKPVNFEDLDLTMEKTIRHVQQSRETIKAIKENNILRMYVDENVLKFMASREFESSLMANDTIVGTVAFIDICSFTTISENEPPDTVVKLLNNYFEVMVKEIIDQGGYVDKFIGDAIMAVFRGDFHLDRAIAVSYTHLDVYKRQD